MTSRPKSTEIADSDIGLADMFDQSWVGRSGKSLPAFAAEGSLEFDSKGAHRPPAGRRCESRLGGPNEHLENSPSKEFGSWLSSNSHWCETRSKLHFGRPIDDGEEVLRCLAVAWHRLGKSGPNGRQSGLSPRKLVTPRRVCTLPLQRMDRESSIEGMPRSIPSLTIQDFLSQTKTHRAGNSLSFGGRKLLCLSMDSERIGSSTAACWRLLGGATS